MPESKADMEFWGADVVVSLSHLRANGNVRTVAEAAVIASELKDFLVCPILPICTGGHTAADCEQFGRFVVFADFHLAQGNRVAVHCGHGLHRTGVAIYLLLRSIVGAP